MDEQDLEMALSYGPEDAFVLHRYHCPPRSASGAEGVSRPSAPPRVSGTTPETIVFTLGDGTPARSAASQQL